MLGNENNHRKTLSRRSLNFSAIAEEDDMVDACSSFTSIIHPGEVEQKDLNISTGNELTVNNENFISTFELEETLQPDNSSNGKLTECTLVSYQNVPSSSKDFDLTNVSQSEAEVNHSIINYNIVSFNEDDHQRNNIDSSDEVLTQTETAAANLEPVLCATNAKKLTRKRVRNEREKQDNKSKRLKNSGEAYVGCRSKKEFKKKTIKAECKCQKKCGVKINQQQRESIMQQYYQLANHELQWQFIAKHTIAEEIKKVTINRKNNRTQTIKYYFYLDTEKVQVCKTFFINTLSISHQTVYTALEKIKYDKGFSDNRGCHDNRPRKMSLETEENIKEHIQLFPAVESHYTRKNSARQYLSELLNISKMYRLYEAWFTEGHYSCRMASKRQYETIFNTRFNYSFHRPKKDQCGQSALYRQADPSTEETLRDKFNQHQKNKERVRQIKNEEKQSADLSDTTVAIFDLEKVLNIPQSQVGIFHYKRKYPVYNFTIFDSTRLKGYCYVWHYAIAKRGAIEIGSCLWQFLMGEAERGIKNISFYSDGCGGQNKNRFIFAFYIFAAQKLKINITHRFFETGHGQSEGDSMHSNIERELKHRVVYTPEQIYAIILNAKVNGEKYTVKEMTQNEFKDMKELIKNKNWAKDEEGHKVAWSKIMEVSVLHSQPTVLRFKYDFDADYSRLNVELLPRIAPRNKRGKHNNASTPLTELQLKPAYNKPLPISKALHDDLMSLCRAEAIPSYYHGFYNSLTFANCSEELNHEDFDEVQED